MKGLKQLIDEIMYLGVKPVKVHEVGTPHAEDEYTFNLEQLLYFKSLILNNYKRAAAVMRHSDDYAVDCFAAAMKAKMAKKRGEGRSGWQDTEACSADYLNTLLCEHIVKGDPVDVGNLCMMLFNRGEATTLPKASKNCLKTLISAVDVASTVQSEVTGLPEAGRALLYIQNQLKD